MGIGWRGVVGEWSTFFFRNKGSFTGHDTLNTHQSFPFFQKRFSQHITQTWIKPKCTPNPIIELHSGAGIWGTAAPALPNLDLMEVDRMTGDIWQLCSRMPTNPYTSQLLPRPPSIPTVTSPKICLKACINFGDFLKRKGVYTN